MYPKLEQHCPFKAQLAEAMDGDLCRICNHIVHDLDAMTPEARRAFLSRGGGTVCVRYRMPAALAAAALVASVTALPAASQDAPPPLAQEQDQDDYVGEGEIVGVFSRVDPCEIVETVRGRAIRDEKACRRDRFADKAAWRARTKR